MDYKKEIENLKNEFNKKIEELENKIKNKEDVLKEGDKYFYIDSAGQKSVVFFDNGYIDKYRIIKNNIWLDYQECERYNNIDKKYRQLIYDLNKENPIDWNNENQHKYYLNYMENENIYINSTYESKSQNLYCTDKNFVQKAIDLIGENDLKWYFKNYRA